MKKLHKATKIFVKHKALPLFCKNWSVVIKIVFMINSTSNFFSQECNWLRLSLFCNEITQLATSLISYCMSEIVSVVSGSGAATLLHTHIYLLHCIASPAVWEWRRRLLLLLLMVVPEWALLRLVTARSGGGGVKGGEDKALCTARLRVINGRGVCCAGHPRSSYRSVFL